MDNNLDNQKKKWSLFGGLYRDGKGVSKDEENITKNPTFANFFKLSFRTGGRFLSLNLTYVLGNFPIFFILLAMSGYFSRASTAPYYQLYSALYGTAKFDSSPVMQSLLGIFGFEVPISVNTTATYVLYGLGLLTFLTFGLVNIGVTHIMRSIVRGEPVFFLSDFKYAIRKNFRQGLIFGVIDLLLLVIFGYDIVYLFITATDSVGTVMFYLTLFVFAIYMMARFYVYTLIITFDLSLPKIIKNGVIFAFLGIKRNILALFGILLTAALNYFLFLLFIPLGSMLPFLITISLCSFMGMYAAWPNIKKYMVDPYYEKHPEEADIEEEPEEA